MVIQVKQRLLMLLAELEQELQELDWWEQQPPSVQALQSQQPFCVDTLEFSQWLQWVFIPRMRSLASSEHDLPQQCAIYEMAEVVYREKGITVSNVLSCLKNIDAAIMTPHRLH